MQQPVITELANVNLPRVPQALELDASGSVAVYAIGSEVVLVEPSSGDVLHRWRHPNTVVDISLSPDGQRVAVADGTAAICVYDTSAASGAPMKGARLSQLTREGAPDFLRSDPQQHVAFYPEGTKCVSLGSKQRMYVSDVSSGRWDHIMFIKQPDCDLAVSPDGSAVVLFGSANPREVAGHLSFFRVNRGLQPVRTQSHAGEGRVSHASFSPDGRLLATYLPGHDIRLWVADSGDLSHSLDVSPNRRVSGIGLISRDLVVLAIENELEIRAVQSGKSVARLALDNPIDVMSPASSGRTIATASTTGISFWSLSTAH